MPVPYSLSMSPQPDPSNFLSLGQAALDSGAVSPEEVKATQDHFEGGGSLNNLLPALAKATGKGKQTKADVKQTMDKKNSRTTNIWATPEAATERANTVQDMPFIQEQQKGIDEAQNLLSMQQNAKMPQDDYWVRPLLALADSETGSKLSQGYTPQETIAQRSARLAGSADELQKRRNDLSKLIFEGTKSMKEGTETNAMNQNTMQQLGRIEGMINGNSLSDYRGKKLISDAGAAFDKDQILKEVTRTNNNLDRAISMMDGKTPITAKNFAILQQDLINSMAPGGAATEGKVNREMVSTLSTYLNDLAQKGGSIQDLRKSDPALFKQIRGLITQVQQDYHSAGVERASTIADNYTDVADPAIQSTVARKLDYWKNRKGHSQKPSEVPPPGGKTAGADLNADLSKMSKEELKAWLETHGG